MGQVLPIDLIKIPTVMKPPSSRSEFRKRHCSKSISLPVSPAPLRSEQCEAVKEIIQK